MMFTNINYTVLQGHQLVLGWLIKPWPCIKYVSSSSRLLPTRCKEGYLKVWPSCCQRGQVCLSYLPVYQKRKDGAACAVTFDMGDKCVPLVVYLYPKSFTLVNMHRRPCPILARCAAYGNTDNHGKDLKQGNTRLDATSARMTLFFVSHGPCQPSFHGSTTSLYHIAPTMKLNMPHLSACPVAAESLSYSVQRQMRVMLTSLSGEYAPNA